MSVIITYILGKNLHKYNVCNALVTSCVQAFTMWMTLAHVCFACYWMPSVQGVLLNRILYPLLFPVTIRRPPVLSTNRTFSIPFSTLCSQLVTFPYWTQILYQFLPLNWVLLPSPWKVFSIPCIVTCFKIYWSWWYSSSCFRILFSCSHWTDPPSIYPVVEPIIFTRLMEDSSYYTDL